MPFGTQLNYPFSWLNQQVSPDQEIPCTMESDEGCPPVMPTKKCLQSRLCAKIVTW